VTVQGLLREGILGSVRPSVHITKKEELTKLLLEKVFSGTLQEDNEGMDFAGGAEGVGEKTPKYLDSMANIRLFSTFLNKAEGLNLSINFRLLSLSPSHSGW